MDATLTALGFRATRTDEGLVVHQVPIFCACARGEVKFDEEWIRAAVKKAMQRQRENYFSPLHIRHHEPATEANDSVRPAGYFRVVGTSPITLNGARRTAVLADLVFTDPYAADEVMSMRLPYRSVEIFDIEAAPSIDGLALLDHEAPYLELPMLKVDEVADERENPGGVALATFRRPESPQAAGSVVAFSRRGNSVSLTFREDAEMATPTETDPKPVEGTTPTPETLAGCDEDKKTNMADDDDKDKDDEKMQDEALDISKVVAAIEGGTISVSDMDALLAAIQSQNAVEETEEEPEMAPAPGEVMKADPAQMTAFAKLQGKVHALEAGNVERDKNDKCVGEVATAMSRLNGLPLGSDLEGKLVKFHKKHGGAAFGDYVEALAQNTAVVPGEREDTATAFNALGGKIPEVAMKYQDKGTEVVERAVQLCHEWDELRGQGMKASQESYVKTNIARLTQTA